LRLLWLLYLLGVFWTFICLTYLDYQASTGTSWIVSLPANLVASAVWPMYWLILHPGFFRAKLQMFMLRA